MFKGNASKQGTVRQLATVLIGLFIATSVYATSATRTSAFEYDPVTGLLTKEIIEPDNSNLCLVTTYTYDNYGNKTAVTTRNCNGSSSEAASPTGDAVIAPRTYSSTYDAIGQFPVASTNALGQSETKVFDPKWGTPLSLTGPNGLTSTWQYDGFGRKVLETRADGTKTQWSYQYCAGVNGGTATCPTIGGAAGTWLVQTTPQAADGTQNGPITKTYYDSLNRAIRSETQGYDGNGTATAIYKDTQYDSLGRPYMTSRPYYAGQTVYWVTVTYDSLGRTISQTDADGAVTSTAYNGLSVMVTNPKGQTRTTVKNSQGKIASVTDANGQAIAYQYDAFGNLTQTLDPLGNKTLLSYDLKGRKTGMTDPDMGSWTYVYDALGQLVKQTDAKGQLTTISYDQLGRMVQRTEADLVSKWYYDSYKGGGACAKGIGKLCQAEADNGYNRVHSYDSLGRPSQTVTTIDTNYTTSVTYDANGHVQTQTYPGGVGVRYVYTPLGYLKEVHDTTSNALYWQANSLDAEGHLLQQTYGNGVITQQTYNPQNGRLTGILAGAGNGVQNLTYTYDVLGNIASRNDANQNLAETFTYDSLSRLTSATVNSNGAGIVTTNYGYNAIGNITSRSDVGNYTYPASGGSSIRPHAISRLDLPTGEYRLYAYDANGNLNSETEYDSSNNPIATKGRIEVQTSFNMPQAIGAAIYSSGFTYGPEHQRARQTSTSASGTTIYLNPGNEGALLYEKDYHADSSTEERNFITAGGTVVAMIKQITNGSGVSTNVLYLHRDNLGSTTTITDSTGNAIERLAYEPFGKRRFPSGLTDPNNTIFPVNTERGFTNHEHLDELGLIHMNGRIYDPLIGRFTSPDPNIQDPNNLQTYNRYTYVQNNPLLYTDPSGYFSLGGFIHSALTFAFKPTIQNGFNFVHNSPGQGYVDNLVMKTPLLYSAGQIAATYFTMAFCGGCGGQAWGAYYAYESTGSMSAAYKSFAISSASAYAFSYVDTSFSGTGANSLPNAYGNILFKAAAQGAIGGATSELQGGSFSKGFFMSAAGSAAKSLYTLSMSGEEPSLRMSNGQWTVKDGIDVTPLSSGLSDMGLKITPEMMAKYGDNIENMPFLEKWGSEASPLLRWISSNVPGMEGISRLHDVWGSWLDHNGMWNVATNIGAMTPAAAITYVGVAGPAGAQTLETGQTMKRRIEQQEQ
jgi:RHS repeat-associated protein